MQVTQCDNAGCRKIGPVPPVDWIVLGQIEAPGLASFASLMGREKTGVEGSFCSWACVVEFAYFKSIEAVKAAGEPAPDGGETP